MLSCVTLWSLHVLFQWCIWIMALSARMHRLTTLALRTSVKRTLIWSTPATETSPACRVWRGACVCLSIVCIMFGPWMHCYKIQSISYKIILKTCIIQKNVWFCRKKKFFVNLGIFSEVCIIGGNISNRKSL